MRRKCRHGQRRAELISHQVFDLCNRKRHLAAAKSMQVLKSRMSTDTDAFFMGARCDTRHDIGITGMKSAGDIRRLHQPEQAFIAHLPGPFGHIGIEIENAHIGCSS